MQVEELVWKVPSGGVFYTVHRATQSCDCKLRCGFCGTCIHMYTCSCIDTSAIHSTVCKHSHLVQVHVTGACESPMTDDSQQDPHSSAQPANINYFAQVMSRDNVAPSQQQVTSPKQEMTVLLGQAQATSGSTDDCDVLKAGIVHVRSAISIMQSPLTGNTLIQRKRVAPNANHDQQPRFASPKKQGPPRHSLA